jgi:2-hydroxy-3-oxopropionate reductase
LIRVSISPIETKEFAAIIKNKPCGYLDAPVSGGEVGAKTASLTIMVGGSAVDFAKATPISELMGTNITLVGDNAARRTTKQLSLALQGIKALGVNLPNTRTI